ncbi:Cyclic di-GMP phosphodiesterase [Phycisphaerales bacterium]|nr:Cyclic di-GMP phosphodiesterase [Phycisphaerales bacterium]
MLRVPIAQAKAGMVLALGVPHPAVPKAYLLRDGAALEDRAIAKLAELGIRDLWIRYPGLEDLVQYVNPGFQNACRELTSNLSATFDAAMMQSRVELEFSDYRRAVVGMLERIAENSKAAIFVNDLGGPGSPAARHGSAVCALSLLMGLKLDFYLVRERARMTSQRAKDLAPLGVGAMLHDVGMTRLPPEVSARWAATGNEDDSAWREHALLGFDLVKDQLEPAAAGAVLHHHQRWNGSGFPCIPSLSGACIPPRGSHIHIFARIVAAADLFDRLRHAPGADPALPAVTALAQLRREPFTNWLDPMVFRALLAVAPPYAPGSLVRLSDGREAAVVAWSPEDPCRPTVEILGALTAMPRRGEPSRERLNLRTERTLSIAVIDGQNVSSENFDPASKDDFDLMRYARGTSQAPKGKAA